MRADIESLSFHASVARKAAEKEYRVGLYLRGRGKPCVCQEASDGRHPMRGGRLTLDRSPAR